MRKGGTRKVAAGLAVVACLVAAPTRAAVEDQRCDPVLRCVTSMPSSATLVASRAGGGLDSFVGTSTAGSLELVGLDGSLRWSATVASPVAALPRLLAAGDFTGDGITDFVFWILRGVDPPSLCGGTPVQTSSLVFVDGASGAVSQPVSPLQDICWHLNFNYPTHQWDFGTVYIGDLTAATPGNEVVLMPYYATEGTVLADLPSGWQPVSGRGGRTSFAYPSTPAFDLEYDAANPRGCSALEPGGPCYIPYSHVANGIFVRSGGAGHSLFVLTSNRALLYRPDLTPTGDTTWLPGGTTANGGRNYGLLESYSSGGQNYVDLIGGCTVEFSRRAALTGAPDGGDPLCGIVRHLERFQVDSNTVARLGGAYYSYSPQDGSMKGRVEYPAHAHVPIVGRGRIWTVFDVYDGTRWSIQVFTSPRQTTPALTLPGWFVWDAADVDRDGRSELLATRMPVGQPIPPRQFDILSWTHGRFRSIRHINGYLPALVRLTNTVSRHTDDSNIFSSLTVDLDHRGYADILVEDAKANRSWLDWRSCTLAPPQPEAAITPACT